MTDDLYERFSTALRALPETDLLATLGRVEHAIDQACRTAEADAVFMPIGMTGQRAEAVFRVLAGRRIAEIGEVWTRLRNELADELARRGTPLDLVRELRGGGPLPLMRTGTALNGSANAAPANDVDAVELLP